MATDRLGKNILPGDVIAYGARSGDTGALKLRVVIDTKDGSMYVANPSLEYPWVEIPVNDDKDVEMLKANPNLATVHRSWPNQNIVRAKDLAQNPKFSASRSTLHYTSRSAVVSLPAPAPDEPLETKALRLCREKVLNGEIRRK